MNMYIHIHICEYICIHIYLCKDKHIYMNMHTIIHFRMEDGVKGQRGAGNQTRGGVYLKVRSIQVPHCRESYGIVLDIYNNHGMYNNASGVYSNMNKNVDNGICDIPNNGSGMNRNMIGNVDITKIKVVYSGDCRPSQALITAGNYVYMNIC
jgi:ribonuclease BN (tRNA processing enzyme)